MIKAVFFDLDGTLLPLNEDEFTKLYFSYLSQKMVQYGYDQKELISVIWQGTKAMYLNDGSKTNMDVFWSVFALHYGKEKLKDIEKFDSFYTNEFTKTKNACKENPIAKEIVDFCNKNNLITVLSTNPIFPSVGTITRMSYINLKEEDFDFVTYYENFNYCKPNPMYFKVLLEKFNLNADEVIVFGNNTYEDGECSRQCNIKCYMVGDYVIHHPKSINKFEHIKMEQVIDTIKKHINI